MNEIVYSNIQAKSQCTYECLGAGIWQLSDNNCPNSSDCANTYLILALMEYPA